MTWDLINFRWAPPLQFTSSQHNYNVTINCVYKVPYDKVSQHVIFPHAIHCHDHIVICYQLNESCMSLCNMDLVIHVRNETFACIWCHHKLIIGLMWIFEFLFCFVIIIFIFLVTWRKLGVVGIIIWCGLEHVGERQLRCNTFWHIWSSY